MLSPHRPSPRIRPDLRVLTAAYVPVNGRPRAQAGARIVVADGQPAFRAGIRLALGGDGFTVCAEAGDASTAVDAALRESPDLCLVDTGLPGGGIAAAAAIKAGLCSTAVLMVTETFTEPELFECVRAGASGYLAKDVDPRRLPEILRAALRGEAVVPRILIPALFAELRARGRRRVLALECGARIELTPREWEVVELIRDGLETTEIAARLFVAPGTVRTHLAAAMRKLGVRDRQAAIRLLER